jgi:hypothetical protein
MYPEDIIAIIYPNLKEVRGVIIVDPFDKKAEFYPVNSIDEVKEVLKRYLPFCDQGHPAEIHYGDVVVVEWENLPSGNISVHKPEDIDKVLN